MSDCPKQGGCPTIFGLIVTVVIAFAAAAALSSLAKQLVQLGGVADQAVKFVIVMGVILAAITGLRAFRQRRKLY